MALPLIAESLDAIPEAFRGEYTEADGKFKLNVDGVEDVTGLKNTLAKFKADQKAAADKLKAFEGIDPEEYKTLKQEREALEEAKLKAEGKADEIAQRKIEKALAAKNKEIEAIAERNKQLENRVASVQQKILAGHIAKEASGKVHAGSGSMQTLSLLAQGVFTLDENDNPVQLDSDGQVVLGKDGKTPFGVSEWLEGLKETHPFLFPANSSGGGASGSGSGGGSKQIMSRDAFFAMTPEKQASFMKGGGALKD